MPVRIDIVVQPRSSRSEVAGLSGAALKVRVHAPPAEGKANEECIAVLSRFFDVPKSAVRVAAGASGRKKIVEIDGVAATDVERRLESLR